MSDWIEILLGCIGLIWLCVWANKPHKMSDREIEEWNRNADKEGYFKIETKEEEQERLRRQKEEEEEKRRKELKKQEELRIKELNERINRIKILKRI